MSEGFPTDFQRGFLRAFSEVADVADLSWWMEGAEMLVEFLDAHARQCWAVSFHEDVRLVKP